LRMVEGQEHSQGAGGLMSARPLSREELQRTVDAWAAHGNARGPTALALEITSSALGSRLSQAKSLGIAPTVTPGNDIHRSAKPRIRVQVPKADGTPIRVLAIGDAHDSPEIPDKSRFRWMGQLAAEEKPDWIVQIGDFL